MFGFYQLISKHKSCLRRNYWLILSSCKFFAIHTISILFTHTNCKTCNFKKVELCHFMLYDLSIVLENKCLCYLKVSRSITYQMFSKTIHNFVNYHRTFQTSIPDSHMYGKTCILTFKSAVSQDEKSVSNERLQKIYRL